MQRPSQHFSPSRPSFLVSWAIVLAAFGSSGVALAQSDEPAPLASAEQGASRESLQAAYQFAIAKLLAGESYYDDAQAAYERALELESGDPYGRVELALFHVDMAQISRNKAQAFDHLRRAAEEIGRAQRIEPDNMEVLQSYAQIHLQLAEQEPASLGKAQQAFERLREEEAGDMRALPSLAQIYLWQRQPGKAAEVLEDAVRRGPTNRLIQSMLVDALLQAGELAKAETVLAENVAAGQATVDGRLQLAELLSRRGDHAAAIEALRGAEDGSERLEYRHRLTRELHLNGDNTEALAQIELLATEFPTESAVKRLKIGILAAMARNKEALALLEAELADKSEIGTEDLLLRSRLLERVGRNDDAARLLAELGQDETDPERALELRLMRAGIEERGGRIDSALEMLQPTAGDTDPRSLGTLARARSELLERYGRSREALTELELELSRLQSSSVGDSQQATAVAERLGLRRLILLSDLEDWPRLHGLAAELMASEELAVRSAARLLAAEALAEMDRVDEAMDLLAPERVEQGAEQQALARRVQLLDQNGRGEEGRRLLATHMAPDSDVDQLFFAAQVLQQLESYKEMLPLLERARNAAPDSTRVLFLLGATQERLGAFDQAAEVFLQLLEVEPNHAPSLNYLGYMWADRGENLEQALDMIRRAVALDQDNGAYLDSLGWVLYRLGDFEGALQHLEWAVRLVPTDPTVFDHLGDLYLELGQLERARSAYGRALELDPEDPDAVRSKLERLPPASI